MADKPASGRGRAMLLMGQKETSNGVGARVPPSDYVPPVFPMGGRGRAQLLGQRLTVSSSCATSGLGTMSSPSNSSPSPESSSPDLISSTIVGSLASENNVSRGRGAARMLTRPQTTVSLQSESKSDSPDPSTIASITTSLQSATIVSQSSTTIPSELDSEVVKRHGSCGEAIRATGNYISLQIAPGSGAYEYDVKYDPAQDAKAFRIRLLKEHRNLLGPHTFDGYSLFLPKKLPNQITNLTSPHPVTGTPVNLKVIFKKSRQFGEMKHLYNILFKRIMSELKLVEFKRQYFDPKNAIFVPQYKLEIWPGYVTAVDEYEGGVMLCIDPSHRVLRKQSVLELVRDLIAHYRVGWEQELKAALVGQTVMTTYNNKCYMIDDIDFGQNPMSTFSGKDGDITFMEYYKTNYAIEVTDVHQPLLINRKEKRENLTNQPQTFMIALIPEFCNLTGISDEMRSDFNLMKEMAKYTRITPNQRYFAIKKYINNVNSNPAAKQMLSNWGLSIRPETVELNARTLQPEQIIFGENRKVAGNVNADWGREATSSKAIQPVDIEQWAILHTKKDTPCTKNFVDTLQRSGPPMGIKVSAPKVICLQSDKPEAYSLALKSVISPHLQIVVCICPTARDDRYTAIKKTCCVENPIPSQVINSRTLFNRDKLRAVVQKVALQMNCKLGGTLWAINMPYKNTMVVGIDVYHGVGNASCAGFVASFNSTMTRWISYVIIQEKGQEIIDGLKKSFVDAIKHYYSFNGQFPGRIFVYRDGVGDGQLPVCKEYEVPQLESCFPLVDPSYSPPMTFIVVQKRINTRIFAELNGGSQLENPNPGTIVDNTITRKALYDFFLVSQKVRQGTVTPTHYIVLHDTNGISPDHVQRFTYKMCHLYYNWPGTVRVPAPCQYAHKLAFLMGQVVRREHHPSLSDKLFFL